MKTTLIVVIILLALIPTALAKANLLQPVIANPQQTAIIAPAAPGSQLYLTFDREAQSGYSWYQAKVEGQNWESTAELDYKHLYVTIPIPEETPEGQYSFKLTLSSDKKNIVDEETLGFEVDITRKTTDLVEIQGEKTKDFYADQQQEIPIQL